MAPGSDPSGRETRAGLVSLVLPALAGAYGSLDTMLNIAFPDLVDGLGIELVDLQWIIVAYVLSYGGLLIGAGRLGDWSGHRRALRWGGVISAAGMVMCGAAPNLGVLIGGRVVQGVGTALVMASAPALVTGMVGEERRGRALGLFQMSAAVGLAVGPLVGGPIVAGLGWRWVFWIRVPVGLALTLLAGSHQTDRPRVTGDRAPVEAGRRARTISGPGQAPDGRAPVDLIGPVAFAVVLAAGLTALNLGFAFGPGHPAVLVLASATAVFGWGLARQQRVSADPVVDLGLLGRPAFLIANLLNLIANGAAFVGWLFVPEYVVDELGAPVIVGGIVLAASPVAMAVVAPVAGRWSDRYGPSVVATAGLVMQTVGLAAGIVLARERSVIGLGLSLALVGAGLGLFTVPNMSSVMGSLPADRQGVAGGVTLTMRTAGIVIGVAGLSAVFDARLANGFGSALADTFLVAAVATAAAAALSIGRARPPSSSTAGRP